MEQNLFTDELLKKIIAAQSILVASDFDLQIFMQWIVEEMQTLTPATGAVVEFVDGDEMVYRAVAGSASSHNGMGIKMKGSISGLCISTNTTLLSSDTEDDPRVNLEACRQLSARSLVAAPLHHENETLGVLKIISNKASEFNPSHVQILQIMAGLISAGLKHQRLYETNQRLLHERNDAIKTLKKAQKKLAELANHDLLTGLPNRSFFNECLKRAMYKVQRTQTPLALLYLDIDHFKQVNDNLGHAEGDKLLQFFAKRIKSIIRRTDLAIRLGGDEFIILIEELPSQTMAMLIAQKIIDQVKKEFKLQTKNLTVTISIGISIYSGDEQTQPLDLVKQADSALYIAKAKGRNMYCVY